MTFNGISRSLREFAKLQAFSWASSRCGNAVRLIDCMKEADAARGLHVSTEMRIRMRIHGKADAEAKSDSEVITATILTTRRTCSRVL